MKLDKCCCCIPLNVGTHILGILTILGSLDLIMHFDWIKAVLFAAVIISYFVMIFKNEATTRMILFITMLTKMAIDPLLFLFWLKPE